MSDYKLVSSLLYNADPAYETRDSCKRRYTILDRKNYQIVVVVQISLCSCNAVSGRWQGRRSEKLRCRVILHPAHET